MIRLTYFEIRKNYLRGYVVIALLVFLLLNIFIIYKNYVSGDSNTPGYNLPHSAKYEKWWNSYDDMHDKLSGKLTMDKVRFVVDEYNRLIAMVSDRSYSTEEQEDTYTGYIWGDYVFITKYFYRPMKYISTYESAIKQVIKNAEDNIEFYSQSGNNFDKTKNQFIKEHYSERKVSVFYNSKVWDSLFKYSFSDLLIILLMFLGIVPIFVNEKVSKMEPLILSSRKGRINMSFVKVFSVLLYIVFLVSFFSSINFLVFKLLYGLSGIEMPIYAIEAFQYTPLNCSVGMFYVLQILLKALGFFVFGMWICIISALFQRVIYPYLISALSMVVGIYASGYVASIETIKTILALISPFTLLSSNRLFNELLAVNIRDIFYLRAHVAIIIQVCIMVFLYFLIYTLISTKSLGIKKKFFMKVGV